MLALLVFSYLLVDSKEIEAAKAKAATHDWARAALESIITNAERALRDPVRLPDRGGQWPHWYSCKRDGARLSTISPTEHRCPVCGAVYRGEPYDSVVLYNVHSRYSRAVRDLGLGYRFTGRAEFAARAREILVGYADRYRTYPRHDINGADRVGGGRIMAQTLDESVWLIPVAFGYSLVRDIIPPPERRHIEQDLLVAAADVIREHRMGIHNIQCWKNSAVGLAGFAADRPDLVKEAIDDPERGFRAQIARGVTDDGLWYEGSLGYHRYTMDALWPLAEAARHAGIDLYSARLATLFDAPLALAFPDGGPPGFNDNRGSNVLDYAPLYELAYARWHKPEYGRLLARTRRESLQALLYGAEDVPSGPMIPEQSSLLASAGYAMLRAGGTAAAMRFGMQGGGHGHPDKLDLVTWAGRLWGLDPGTIAYGVPLHREWYRTTIAHNTVSVDRQIQKPADGELEEWKAAADATTVVASAGDAYSGVRMRRTVTLRAGRIDDRFECSSDREHTYDWAFHAPGSLTTSLALDTPAGKPGDTNGYQHLEQVREAKADGAWWARWSQPEGVFTLRCQGAPGTEVFTAVGPGADPKDRVPMVIIRRQAATTAFECVHEFER